MDAHALRYIFGSVVLGALKEVVYFPLWWYTRGIAIVVKFAGEGISGWNMRTGFGVWLRNVFTPMFGQRDAVGRMISFCIRCANIVIRGIGLALALIGYVALVVAWIAAPIIFVYQIFVYA